MRKGISMNAFKDLEAGIESLNTATLEDEGSKDVSVDLEIQVTEDAVEPVEEAAEVEETTEEAEDSVEEMLGHIDTLEYYEGLVQELGWSQTLAKAIDKDGFIQRYSPTLPACEDLPITGSPNSSETVIALEAFKDRMSQFWEWIKKMANKIWNAIKDFGRMIVNLFSSYNKQAERLVKAMKNVSALDDEKAKKSVKLLAKTDWQQKVTAFGKAKDMLNTNVAHIRNMQIRENKNTNTGPSETAGEDFKKLGITFDENGSKYEKSGGKEMTLTESGWGPGDFKSNGIKAIADFITGTLVKTAKEVESAAKRIASDAAKAETDKEVKSEKKKQAKEMIKSLNDMTRLIRHVNKAGAYLCKMWIKAGYAVYSCRKA